MSSPTAERPAPNAVAYVRLLNLLAAGQIALFVSTALWVPPWKFPQVPLLDFCRGCPAWVDVVFFVAALAGTIFARKPDDRMTRRIRHAICAIGFAGLFLLNQHRIQVWAWQFFILHAWLALASREVMLTGWRWLTISIYAYSALSKIDYAFCLDHGPYLWDGFLHAIGVVQGTARWSANARVAGSALMPIAELTVASLLAVSLTQRLGLYLSVLMHLFLIVALGPWGHDHSAGVLIWNGFFIVQNWLLFGGDTLENEVAAVKRSPPLPSPLPRSGGEGTKPKAAAAWAILAAALIAPLGEPFGWWDHWPGWAVYAARPEKVKVFIHEDDLDKLPAELREFLQEPVPLEPWHPIRIDRWSLAATKTPIYPQARFHVGVALALAKQCELTTLRLSIDSAPDRWTAQRKRTEYVGLTTIDELAATYALNAKPR